MDKAIKGIKKKIQTCPKIVLLKKEPRSQSHSVWTLLSRPWLVLRAVITDLGLLMSRVIIEPQFLDTESIDYRRIQMPRKKNIWYTSFSKIHCNYSSSLSPKGPMDIYLGQELKKQIKTKNDHFPLSSMSFFL